MTLKGIYNKINKKIVAGSSSERKIQYLRKLGVKIGKNCYIETLAFSTEPFLIEIGDHVAIAFGTDFITHDGGIWCFRDELNNGDIFGRIKIGNNILIGSKCTILPNTIIGDNSIVGAGSVVRGNFPDNSVIVGNPAKVVMKMNVQKFLYLQNPGFLRSKNLDSSERENLIKKHFGIE